MKFIPEKKPTIVGFWIPETGSIFAGTLDARVAGFGQRKPFYVFISDVDQAAKIRTQEGTEITCAAGDRVGVSCFHKLEGLQKFVGYHVAIKFIGEQPTRSGGTMKMFDVDVSDDAVPFVGDDDDTDATDSIPF